MNKTIYFLLLFIFIIIFFAASVEKNGAINEHFKEKKSDNISGTVFRLFSRQKKGSLQYLTKDKSLVFSEKKNYKDLWTFFDKQIYSLFYGLYLSFDSKNKKLLISKNKPSSNFWVYTPKGQLNWVNKSSKKTECVPFNTLDDVELDKKKCLEYAFYIEVIPEPQYKKKPGQKIIYRELLEFPEKIIKKINKNVEKQKVYNNIDVHVFGYPSSFKMKNKSNENKIDVELEILKPTVLWVFILAEVKDNLANICKTIKSSKDKSKSTKKKTASSKKSSSLKCEPPKRNYNIEYHIQYPKLVRNISSRVASEFGAHDKSSDKIYRCKDVLTSPYYIKHFTSKDN